MHAPECGTGPWEAFPTLLVMMTEICFLHRHATSMHVDKIRTGNNNCNKTITLITVRVPAVKKNKKTILSCSLGGTLQLLSHGHTWPYTSRLGQRYSAVLRLQCRRHPSKPWPAFCEHGKSMQLCPGDGCVTNRHRK